MGAAEVKTLFTKTLIDVVNGAIETPASVVFFLKEGGGVVILFNESMQGDAYFEYRAFWLVSLLPKGTDDFGEVEGVRAFLKGEPTAPSFSVSCVAQI